MFLYTLESSHTSEWLMEFSFYQVKTVTPFHIPDKNLGFGSRLNEKKGLFFILVWAMVALIFK